MALPVLLQNPGSHAFDLPTATTPRAHNNTKLRQPDDGRRPLTSHTRRGSLRRVKDSTEELRRRARSRTLETATSTASGSSHSPSAGRSFTVANVNNGILYLRPIVRPGNQRNIRTTPDPFVFPQTPPDSAKLDSKTLRPPSNDWSDSFTGSQTPTPIRELTAPPLSRDVNTESEAQKPSNPPLPRPNPHVRSHSFSTIDEHGSQSAEPGTFKVVIERPANRRPKTADTPILQVPIPHYRLGTPRFSARGTAMLRTSTYTRGSGTPGTEDFRSSIFTPLRPTHSFLSSRHPSDTYSPTSMNNRLTVDTMPVQPTASSSSGGALQVSIGPQLYDALTVDPDDESFVRFSISGDIVAATPSRLIAHITSPSFLDYELLSDFFLTFRSFLSSKELTAYLISRLRWAVDRQDDFGRIVRVRTFVALRHWILNYFVDDFVPNYQLRVYFSNLVNALYNDLKGRADRGGGDIKIVGELKKCWRRTCALYWEIPGVDNGSTDNELLPGGQGGSHASMEEILPVPTTPPRASPSKPKLETFGSNPSDQFTIRHMDWARRSRHTPQNSLSSPHIPSQEYSSVQVPLSPESELSMPVLSCSIPLRGMHKAHPPTEVPLHAVPHPIQARFASPQFSLSTSKPNRPSHSHKRSGSFSDALRDHRAPLSIPKNSALDGTISLVSEVPGTLIRGGLFQPGSPYIDVRNDILRHAKSHVELEQAHVSRGDLHSRPATHTPNPGMKKLLGTVRRALSSKQPPNSMTHLTSPHHSALAISPRTLNAATIPPAAGGVHRRRHPRPRMETRIDILAAKVAESFEEAVKQELQNEKKPEHNTPAMSGFDFEFDNREPVLSDGHLQVPDAQDVRIYSNVTAGSRSIVIMDATSAPPVPLMSGALPFPEDDADKRGLQQEIQLQHSPSVDEPTVEPGILETRYSVRSKEVSAKDSLDWRRTSRGSMQRSLDTRRTSSSDNRQRTYSVRRRGSSRASMSRPFSLRRHTSYNSILGRRNTSASIATTARTVSSDPFSLDDLPVGPARQLRRRPGGDLRAVDNVHDLEVISRPHSTGSVSNRTHSIANSVILRADRYIDPLSEVRLEDTQFPESPMNKPISLVNTHSSQPNLRPSFEAEVAKLAALPDDDDDGGIESALMKLEGRYEKKSHSPNPSSRGAMTPEPHDHPGSAKSSNPSFLPLEQSVSHGNGQVKTKDILDRPLASQEAEEQDMYQLPSESFVRRDLHPVSSVVESEDSFSSIPLLDRGFSGVVYGSRGQVPNSTPKYAARPALPNSVSPRAFRNQNATRLVSPGSSVEYVVETESMKRIPRGATLPRTSAPRESFLLDEDEDFSDGNSALTARSASTSHGVRSFFDDEPAVLDSDKDGLSMHPMRHPPTPPLTAKSLNDLPAPIDTTLLQRGLPTPGLTPTARFITQPFGQTSQPLETSIELHELRKEMSRSSSHMPFILAYDSETLAQQLTIVEKDALEEIDWKELIELRWKQSSPPIRDWVRYLRTQEPRGVDVVIARFNLVVKWAISECVLTESVEERAHCIVKYIHIAAHARRLRNYATMYQITIALLSTNISRLKKTWALIPAADIQTMRELEALVQPVRNFHNLRVEMETASVEEGCIPFIGIYTRDLIYNAQKPAFINAPPVGGERLVNFERHHTAAMIVKSLLRLLDASSKYTFKPEPDVISKCLWMAALSDEEITLRSRKCE
ncbi:hypothetical protein GQ43DRAFT_456349 [Delitschia confertaspora ATCC 74209]|uniref:Ras GEF n=1 Tax=Delitschia confertaspora ATCC 74209 TaxID=1513339 RepID=A0A9P4JK33_9PLEO|nr:hypothetical protein GQ43DRAFT_456349 [Delitschia confertaspora ATCC 74209]